MNPIGFHWQPQDLKDTTETLVVECKTLERVLKAAGDFVPDSYINKLLDSSETHQLDMIDEKLKCAHLKKDLILSQMAADELKSDKELLQVQVRDLKHSIFALSSVLAIVLVMLVVVIEKM